MGFHCEEARSTILFDLDGTLLPMDMKEFERAYFGGLCRAIPEMAPQELIPLHLPGERPGLSQIRSGPLDPLARGPEITEVG